MKTGFYVLIIILSFSQDKSGANHTWVIIGVALSPVLKDIILTDELNRKIVERSSSCISFRSHTVIIDHKSPNFVEFQMLDAKNFGQRLQTDYAKKSTGTKGPRTLAELDSPFLMLKRCLVLLFSRAEFLL